MNRFTIPHFPRLLSGAGCSLLIAGLALSATAPQAKAQDKPAATFSNPVIAGDFADPSIIRVGDVYYATGTSSEWAPYYPIYTSKDLVNWEQVGHVFKEMPEWTNGSFWAPEIYHQNGTFYVYYTARRKSDNVSVIGVATSDDPRKGFKDRGVILEWGSEAIDGFVFKDTDGKLYFSWKAYGLERDRPVTLMAQEMTPDALHVKGEAFEMLQENGQPISAEGQVMTRRGDYYYLIYSTKGCCGRGCDYQLEVSRAKSLKGPWESSPHNPMLAGGGDWKCPGHGTMVTLPDGRDYFLYHAYNAKENVFTGRQGMLGEIAWSGDGWPFFASGATPAATEAAPFAAQKKDSQDFVDTFDSSTLGVQWMWDLHNPVKAKVLNGALQLTVPESSSASPLGAFFGVRVKHGVYTLTSTVELSGKAQKGVAVYGEGKSALGVRVEDSNLVVWKVEKGELKKLATAPLPKGDKVQLRVSALEKSRYRFSASTDGKEWQNIGEEDIDGGFIPPWDRAPRAGVIVAGEAGTTGKFDSVELRY